MDSTLTAILIELRMAQQARNRIVGIRVTSYAVEGGVVALAVTPERARVVGKLYRFENGVDAYYDERMLEVLLHPADWTRLLTALPADTGHAVQLMVSEAGARYTLCGLPVAFT